MELSANYQNHLKQSIAFANQGDVQAAWNQYQSVYKQDKKNGNFPDIFTRFVENLMNGSNKFPKNPDLAKQFLRSFSTSINTECSVVRVFCNRYGVQAPSPQPKVQVSNNGTSSSEVIDYINDNKMLAAWLAYYQANVGIAPDAEDPDNMAILSVAERFIKNLIEGTEGFPKREDLALAWMMKYQVFEWAQDFIKEIGERYKLKITS